jgi:hypothetical protein
MEVDNGINKMQNVAITKLQEDVSNLKTELAKLIGKIDTLSTIGKGLIMACGALVGVDLVTLTGGM